ncbi:metallophosphoesterase family protein [Niveibacterium terrae]|uniref:metallophosphoesterase family protein n=1 Tax=Niveibacterium terrae TaxID=3373598 RepID=UPI003A8D8973
MSSRPTEKPQPSLSRRTFFKRTLVGATVIGLPTGLAACGGDSSGDSSKSPVKFAVLSDTHFFDTAALGDSAELDAYLLQDRKMIKESVEIFDAALADIKSQNLDFLLISGDLTKDGERSGHEALAKRLAALGKKVYVIPGNHDINNPHARDYRTTPSTAATQVTPDDFRSIYANCGYGSALYSDPNSLSYIAEPAEGVWLFAIDSCQYANNLSLGEPVTAGAISDLSLGWIEARLQEAKSRGKIVIGMMHHGLVEHFTGQSSLFSEYLVNKREAIAAMLAANGLGVMFTGHFHANDVVGKTYSGKTIYDVETGSTVTAPSPYRFVSLDRSTATLTISTSVVTKTGSHPSDFQTWAKDYLTSGLNTLVTYMLTNAPYNLPSAQVTALLPLIVPALVAHYAGDEKLTDATTQATLAAMVASTDANTKMMGGLIQGLWADPSPADNNLSLTLAKA